MELYEAIYGRKSVRSFDETKDVPLNTVNKLLEAACQAPSAGFIEPWRFFVVRSNECKNMLVNAAYGQSFIAKAPVVIVVCADIKVSSKGYGMRGSGLYAIQDTSAATENLLLAAYSEGLGTCWVGAFDEVRVAQALSLPDDLRPLAMVPLGYPDSKRQKPKRKSISEVTKYI